MKRFYGISGELTVSGAGASVSEPSSFALAGLAVALYAVSVWRRRRSVSKLSQARSHY